METTYYNAKPSKVGNIGKDVSGAKRHNFDTYESDAERIARKQANKSLKLIKEELKKAILSETPDCNLIKALFDKQFELTWGFSPEPSIAKPILAEKRASLTVGSSVDDYKAFNKLVNAYNRLHKDTRGLDSDSGYASYKLKKLARRYQPKRKSIGEQCGQSFDWKGFAEVTAFQTDIDYLAAESVAVQFGNSVTDKERAYIVKSLSDFLVHWNKDSIFNHVNLKPLSWSFGARGKAGSVAYYEPARKLISVNRNNIGSLIHEIGHYIDYKSGNVSRLISFDTVSKYQDSLVKQGITGQLLRYYVKREEIFARAFEAYCYKVKAGFSPFAQAGTMYLPELNDELLNLISNAVR